MTSHNVYEFPRQTIRTKTNRLTPPIVNEQGETPSFLLTLHSDVSVHLDCVEDREHPGGVQYQIMQPHLHKTHNAAPPVLTLALG